MGSRRPLFFGTEMLFLRDYSMDSYKNNEYTERHLRPFFLVPLPTCPYRPLISYKIGQMPTVTRGG